MRILRLLYNRLIYRPHVSHRLKACGCSFRLGYSSELINPQYFSIGADFFTGPNGYFVTNEHSPVSIGDHVMLGPACMIIGGNHDIGYTDGHLALHQHPDPTPGPIKIGDGAWVGARVTILSGADISEGAVVGAMSLVNDYVPPYCVAVGVPARRFCRRFDDAGLSEILRNVNSEYSVDSINDIYSRCGI